jgi:multidrug efflux pump subunit AcrA (membrane-fusion protein)
LAAQLEEADAELALVEEKLARTVMQAPFAGLLVSGDLSMRLGGFVEQGEVLFELTPLSGYRVILKVDERRIADVKVGQEGFVLLASLPRRPFPFVVEGITPITIPEDGRSFFRVEAALKDNSPDLRPGMEGVGKIEIDHRRLIAIWTRNFMEWLRLFVWSWWP